MERIIMHADINHCYAQIEEMKFPEHKKYPMAVGGNQEQRHGIILAKNLLAKKYNIKTGESLMEARKKCPDLLIIPPNYKEYIYYTEKVKDIYRDYTDRVESFGLDEAWVDLSGSTRLFGSGPDIARKIQNRVLNELGLTISIGLSFNKIFAKLGSDLIKPSGFVEITRDNFRDVVWPLPVEDLLYVGRATKEKLNSYGIVNIGHLANYNPNIIQSKLGKIGAMIQYFANGADVSEVDLSTHADIVKSVGNSVTAIRDMVTFQDAKLVLYVLGESVASRLKDQGFKGSVISIGVRNNRLEHFGCQRKIDTATNLSSEIVATALDLLRYNYSFDIPARSIGVSVSRLVPDSNERQMSFFIDESTREKQLILDKTMDQIRSRYGFEKIKRACMLLDSNLTGFNPKGDHTIHPISFLK